MKNKAEIYIQYIGIDSENTSKIDLGLLGESIIGFNILVKEYIKILGIKDGVEVKATKTKEGSLIIDIIIELTLNNPFYSIGDYIAFLKFTNQTIAPIALNSATDIHTSLNEFAKQYPFDAMLIPFLPPALIKLVKWTARQKKKLTLKHENEEIPKKYAERLYKITRGRHRPNKKFLKPFIEDEVSEINISAEKQFENTANINKGNFGDYLGDDEQILPEWENGSRLKLQGSVVGLLSDRGDYMKIKIYGIDKKIKSLVGFPGDNATTEDFVGYYRKDINIDAEVFRQSKYQKPKLIIYDVSEIQSSMLDKIK